MNPNFFTYIESIQVVMQTHQISAFNYASFRHSFKPLQSLQLAKGVVYRIVLPVMTSMTLRSLFPNSVF